MHFMNISNICILNHTTGFLSFLLMTLVPGCVIRSSGNTKTSSAKFQLFFIFMCHMWNVFSSKLLSYYQYLKPQTLSTHWVWEWARVKGYSILGSRQASHRWKRHGFYPQGVYRKNKKCIQSTQISMPIVLSFRFRCHLEGSSWSYIDKTMLTSFSKTFVCSNAKWVQSLSL